MTRFSAPSKKTPRIASHDELTQQVKKLNTQCRTLSKWLLATVEAIENTTAHKNDPIVKAHQAVAAKARKALNKLALA